MSKEKIIEEIKRRRERALGCQEKEKKMGSYAAPRWVDYHEGYADALGELLEALEE